MPNFKFTKFIIVIFLFGIFLLGVILQVRNYFAKNPIENIVNRLSFPKNINFNTVSEINKLKTHENPSFGDKISTLFSSPKPEFVYLTIKNLNKTLIGIFDGENFFPFADISSKAYQIKVFNSAEFSYLEKLDNKISLNFSDSIYKNQLEINQEIKNYNFNPIDKSFYFITSKPVFTFFKVDQNGKTIEIFRSNELENLEIFSFTLDSIFFKNNQKQCLELKLKEKQLSKIECRDLVQNLSNIYLEDNSKQNIGDNFEGVIKIFTNKNVTLEIKEPNSILSEPTLLGKWLIYKNEKIFKLADEFLVNNFEYNLFDLNSKQSQKLNLQFVNEENGISELGSPIKQFFTIKDDIFIVANNKIFKVLTGFNLNLPISYSQNQFFLKQIKLGINEIFDIELNL